MIIDGSQLEGGGQILRVSSALSSVLGIAVNIQSIRALRPKPGLAAQHLSGVKLAQQISEADVQGASIGSTELTIIPKNTLERRLKSRYFEDCGTAGSITLMAQTALPCIALWYVGSRSAEVSAEISSVVLELWGGTNVTHSPPIDHLEHVLLPLLRPMGIDTRIQVTRRGYYPRGGGRVSLTVNSLPTRLTAIDLTTQGSLLSLHAVVYGNVDPSLRQLAASTLHESIHNDPLVTCDGASSLSNIDVSTPSEFTDRNYHKDQLKRKEKSITIGVQVWALTSTGCILAANRDVSQKTVTETSVVDMAQCVLADLRTLCRSGACVDEHTADQLVIYMSQCQSTSRMLAPRNVSSLHLVTAMHVASQLTGVRFEASPQGEHCQLITCYGTPPSAS
eukprot:gene22522-27492_t